MTSSSPCKQTTMMMSVCLSVCLSVHFHDSISDCTVVVRTQPRDAVHTNDTSKRTTRRLLMCVSVVISNSSSSSSIAASLHPFTPSAVTYSCIYPPRTTSINYTCTSKNLRQWDGHISTHADHIRPHAARSYERRISSVTFRSAHLYGNVYMRVGVARALADLSDFGLLREQSSSKWEIPCLGRRGTAMQNCTPLVLSSAEKSVTVRTNKQTNKHTNKQSDSS